MDDVRNATDLASRDYLLKAALDERFDLQDFLRAVCQLETSGIAVDWQLLQGEWQLLWSSKPQQYDEFVQGILPKATVSQSVSSFVVQRICTEHRQIQTEVRFPFGTLNLAGLLQEQVPHRLEFVFQKMRLKVGFLPKMVVPLGPIARGSMQPTYLDQDLLIERGDRGRVSVFVRADLTPTAVPGC